MTLLPIGWLAVCQRPPGNNHSVSLGRSPRQYSRKASSNFGLSMTSRSRRHLPSRTWITMRWLLMSLILSRAHSERRTPVA